MLLRMNFYLLHLLICDITSTSLRKLTLSLRCNITNNTTNIHAVETRQVYLQSVFTFIQVPLYGFWNNNNNFGK